MTVFAVLNGQSIFKRTWFFTVFKNWRLGN